MWGASHSVGADSRVVICSHGRDKFNIAVPEDVLPSALEQVSSLENGGMMVASQS